MNLAAKMNDFDPAVRSRALDEALAEAGDAHPEPGPNVNMHMHSFFSYNAEGWSPTRIAWESRARGLRAAGLCDFDVLDGLDEFLDAGLRVGLRTAVFIECRTYLAPFGDSDLNSPGEPGVAYIMGAGFTRVPTPGTAQAAELQGLRDKAQERNLALVARINEALPTIAVDYARDVLPLTPAGVATERHIVRAYIERAAAVHAGPEAVAAWWATVLDCPAATARELLGTPGLDEKVRNRLAKRGGLGYVQPSIDTFPPTDRFLRWVADCGGIPMAAWLDGTSAGESDPRALLDCLMDLGAEAINIIPDRNWNCAPHEQDVKRARLAEIVAVSRERDLPINIGTEMNKGGLPFADELDGPVLSAYREDFQFGADVMVGHSVLQRFGGLGFADAEARERFVDRRARAAHFAAVGALPALTVERATRFEDIGPAAARAEIEAAAARAHW